MASVVRLDKCQATVNGNIESVVHTQELQNGMVINLGALKAGHTELREVAVPATATLGTEEVLLVYSAEVMYDERKNKLVDFVIDAGKPARAFHLTVGDIFTITDDGITGATVVGEYVIPANASLRLAASATLGTTRFAGKVIAKETFNGVPATVIQVVKC